MASGSAVDSHASTRYVPVTSLPMSRTRLAPSFLPPLLAIAACGGKVTVEGTPVDVCASWAALGAETAGAPSGHGPCATCWVNTIFGTDRSGVCHFEQQRCLADEKCDHALGCSQPCVDANCVNQCIAATTPPSSQDLFLDWARCFALECHDACAGTPHEGDCPASQR
jgi:hypothetical protein